MDTDTTQTADQGSSDFTPAEMAFINSQGSDPAAADALAKEYSGGSSQNDATGLETQKTGSSVENADLPPNDPAEGQLIDTEFLQLDANGQVRDKRTNKWVSHQALHRERIRRQEAQTEAQTLRERLAAKDERSAILDQFLKPEDKDGGDKKADAPKNPFEEATIDPTVDYIGALKQTARRQEWQHQQAQERAQADAKRNEVQTFRSQFESDVAAYGKTTPDFGAALDHLSSTLAKTAARRGVAADKVQATVTAMLVDIAREAQGAKKGMAETLYGLAEDLGYVKKAADPKDDPKKQAEEAIEKIAKVQEASRSITGKGSAAQSDGLPSVDEFINMPTEDALKFERDLGPNKFRAWMKSRGQA
jgi:hypothetical protein